MSYWTFVTIPCLLAAPFLVFARGGVLPDLEKARDKQDRAMLEKSAADYVAAAAKNQTDPNAQYRAALAQSYLAEVAMEIKDKGLAKSAAETGIKAAERAVALKPDIAEYHRLLGTLCGQVIPANVLLGMRYGQCARESIDKSIRMDPGSAPGYLSRGIGNYYLPASLGGGVELAMKDFQKAIALDPKLSEAHLWLGVALRKANRLTEAAQEIEKSLQLNPNRLWAKQQLEKTQAH